MFSLFQLNLVIAFDQNVSNLPDMVVTQYNTQISFFPEVISATNPQTLVAKVGLHLANEMNVF